MLSIIRSGVAQVATAQNLLKEGGNGIEKRWGMPFVKGCFELVQDAKTLSEALDIHSLAGRAEKPGNRHRATLCWAFQPSLLLFFMRLYA